MTDARTRLAEAMVDDPPPIVRQALAALDGRGQVDMAQLDAFLGNAPQPAPQPGGNRTWRNVAAAGELALGALPFTRLGRAMFATIPRAAASAAGLGAAGAAAQHAVTSAEAQPAGELQTARSTIERLRARQGELEKGLARLETEAKRFDSLRTTDSSAVREAQEYLAGQGLYGRRPDGSVVRPDGRWGEGTRVAIEAFRKRNAEAQAAVRRQIEDLGKDLESQGGRLRTLEGDELVREAEESVGPVRRFVRDAGPWAGLAAGAGLGILSRGRAVKHAATASDARARLVNAMLPTPGVRAAPAATRVANVNEFYRQGGAGEAVPFVPAQTPRAFKRNPAGAASASSLYPPGPQYYRGSDYGVAGAFGGEAAISGGLLYIAHNELREAEEALARDKSVANVNRVQAAKDAVAGAEALMRLGLGGASGRLGAALKKPYGAGTRPDVARAEREVIALNQLLARKSPKRKR